MTCVDAYDVIVNASGISCTLTKSPCGQWIHDFGHEGVLRLTCLGSTVHGVQRWILRMTKNIDSWLVAKSDLGGRFVNSDGEPMDVSVTPTIWNVIKRVSLLEDNGHAAITSMNETREQLAQQVSEVQKQQKSHSETVARLLMTHHHDHSNMVDKVAKVEIDETQIERILETITNLEKGIKKVADDLSNCVETNIVEAKYEGITKELAELKEKLHYSAMKAELEEETLNDKIVLLRQTLANCFLRNEEMAQTVNYITKDIAIMHDEIAMLKPIEEVVVDIADYEPGEIPECSCKRSRR